MSGADMPVQARTPDLLDLLRHDDSYTWPVLPAGLAYGWRSIHPNLASRNGYRWAWPGIWSYSPDDGRDLSPETAPTDPCPSTTLGGLCLAKTWGGALTSGVVAAVALLVAYDPEDVLGASESRLRVSRALTLDVVDVYRLRLTGANLSRAGLLRANLAQRDFTGANLCEANLNGATLFRSNLSGANLSRTNLCEANLREAKLDGADFTATVANASTLWPTGFDPSAAGVRFVGASS